MKGFKTLSSKLVYKNPFWQAHEDKITYPDGSKGTYYIAQASDFVAVLAINHQQKVSLVGQYRYAVKKYSWEVVEGGINKKETPLQAAKRELEEEVGLQAQSWKKLGEAYASNGFSTQKGHYFLAQELKDVGTKTEAQEAGEILEQKQVSLNDFRQMINTGKIDDGASITMLYYFDQYQKGRRK